MRASSLLLATGPAARVLLLTLPLLCPALPAQTPSPAQAPKTSPPDPFSTSIDLTIRMLNGKSGKPLGSRFVAVEFLNSPQKLMVFINREGIGHLEVPSGATAFTLIAPAKKLGANQAAYIVCGPFGQVIPVKEVVEHGYVPQNECKPSLKQTAAPGQLLFFIEPLPWYTPALE